MISNLHLCGKGNPLLKRVRQYLPVLSLIKPVTPSNFCHAFSLTHMPLAGHDEA